MPTASKHTTTNRRTAARKAARARAGKDDAIKLLKADHKEVADMVEKFENGRLSKDRKVATAKQICMALTVHAQIEEEIFYPAAREASIRDGEDLLDEAEVEHGSIKELVAAIENASPDDDELFDARVKVLGEYVKHHVKEEENELFPRLRKSDMDLEEVGAQLAARKEQLMRQLKGDA
jgi:hemerythrin-like domain-containing protein